MARSALPAGQWLVWGGQYENLVAAKQRLTIVVPICFADPLAALRDVQERQVRAAGLRGRAAGLTGGIVALWLRDMPFSISAAVGFIALSGVAVLNGLVMIIFINQLREKGEGSTTRSSTARSRACGPSS
jgi:cobalt-zinc-cadmium resistance protein CzcA